VKYIPCDYQALGELAGRIIVMAYDYGPKPEPINLVLQAVEEATALVPANKVLLGISTPGESPQSLLAKIGIAKRYNLGGIALWRLVWRRVRPGIYCVQPYRPVKGVSERLCQGVLRGFYFFKEGMGELV